MGLRIDPTKVCRHLCSKEMLASGDNTEYEKMKGRLFDAFDCVAYWCSCTQTGRGPDDQPVHLEECSLGTKRKCFSGFESLESIDSLT